MTICFYLHVHQPHRIRHYRHSSIGRRDYFDETEELETNNKRVLQKIVEKSYIPTNRVLLSLLERHPEFRLSLSITGTVVEQLEQHAPEALESFVALTETGKVEIVSETYHHSLSFFYSLSEFEAQVELHAKMVKRLFGQRPSAFRNTELAYNNDLGRWAGRRGYKAVLIEGWDYVLGDRSPNFLYHPPGEPNVKLLLKNYRLSDDIAFRFSENTWEGWPLTVEKFASWASRINGNGDLVDLFMDYETFGEHQWEDTGIFDFLSSLPGELLKHPDNNFMTVSEAASKYPSRGELDVPHVLTWADTERDLSAWRGNAIQEDALSRLYELEARVFAARDPVLIDTWRRLTTSDHFYYMCTKWFNDGDVHAYFSPYESPYDAFSYYMNVLKDLELRITAKNA